MREVRDVGGGECALGNSHRKAARNGGEDWRMWTLCDGERDVGNDGETGEDARPALVISESGEDERNGGSTAYGWQEVRATCEMGYAHGLRACDSIHSLCR